MTDSPTDGIAETPEPPYVAVIFTSLRTDGDQGYGVMAVAMDTLAAAQPGYLGVESAREQVGITVSYWRNEDAARAWKMVAAHLVAQRRGREVWYRDYRVRIATVRREYGPSGGGPSGGGPSGSGPSGGGPSGGGPIGSGPSGSGPSGSGPSDGGPSDGEPRAGDGVSRSG